MRLFVAIELSKKVRSALSRVQSKLQAECSGVRWVPPENIHLTVKFIGDVSDRDVDAVARAVAGVAAEVRPFDMEITGSGCFPPRGPVRIVWAGVGEESGALLGCAERLEDALWELGVAREPRRYSPHLTVGRVRRDVSEGSSIRLPSSRSPLIMIVPPHTLASRQDTPVTAGRARKYARFGASMAAFTGRKGDRDTSDCGGTCSPQPRRKCSPDYAEFLTSGIADTG